MISMRAAGRYLSVGELREAMAQACDDDLVMAHGVTIEHAEAFGGAIRLDEDSDADDKAQALADLLALAENVSTDRKLKLKDVRELAADLVDEWGHLA